MSLEERFNRTELIKQAREECSKNLQTHSAYGHEYVKESRSRKENSTEVEFSQVKVKFFMIRIVTAVVLFLCFVAVMELNLSYDAYTGKQFVNQMQSNILFEKAEECVSTILQKTGLNIKE